jgi:hypothetical protein
MRSDDGGEHWTQLTAAEEPLWAGKGSGSRRFDIEGPIFVQGVPPDERAFYLYFTEFPLNKSWCIESGLQTSSGMDTFGSVRAAQGLFLSALSVFLCKFVLYGVFVWAHRALKHQKRWFRVRADAERLREVGAACRSSLLQRRRGHTRDQQEPVLQHFDDAANKSRETGTEPPNGVACVKAGRLRDCTC